MKQFDLFGQEIIEEEDDKYTKKIKTPIYEPKNKCPDLLELRDRSKLIRLSTEIKNSNLSEDEKRFLLDAATRHIVFNYGKIADYYSYASKEMQRLMEKSALVVIDFNKAYENGFIKLAHDVANQYFDNYGEYFCIIIISHGRPNDIITLKTLIKAGCTIPTYILIDNHDKKADNYLNIFKDKVFVFDKDKYANMVDHYDNFNNLRSTTHARNASFDLANELGYKYFLVLDDDYTEFKMRINSKLEHPTGRYLIIKNIDNVFHKTLDYYKNSNFKSICFSQGGDWFGGETNFNKAPKRKAMNSFFCSTDRRFWFESRLNEDVNTYITLGGKGDVFLTIPFIQLDQVQTQKTKGGMTEAYIDGGTYIKSFYSIITRPNCTKINMMGRTNLRFHHSIKWENAVPKIIDKKYKK